MRIHWMAAVFLSAAVAAGCNRGNDQNTQNPQENQAIAPQNDTTGTTATDRETVSPGADTTATGTESPRAGTTVRPSTPERSANAPRPASPSTRVEERSAAREAPAPAPPPAPVTREVTVPAGTTLPLELLTALSSETAAVETPVRARLRQAILVDGTTAIPAGTVLNGTVTEVERAGRVRGRSHLAFRFDEATIDGVRENLRTNPLAFEGEASKGEDATKIGGGAGIGAAIGGLLGGGKGAAKGAAIGGAAGTGAVLATRGKEVELAAGADITAVTASPVTVVVK